MSVLSRPEGTQPLVSNRTPRRSAVPRWQQRRTVRVEGLARNVEGEYERTSTTLVAEPER